MATVATSLLTLVVLVTSTMLLAVQLASAQLTPRIIAFVYRNNTRKLLLSFFVFTFTFSVGVLVRIEDSVPLLSGYFAAYGFLLNLALMLYFDGVGKTLRPSSVLGVMGLSGREVIASVYPRLLDEQQALSPEPIAALDGKPDRVIVNSVGGSVYNDTVSKNAQGDVTFHSKIRAPLVLSLSDRGQRLVATTCFLIPASPLSPYTQMVDW